MKSFSLLLFALLAFSPLSAFTQDSTPSTLPKSSATLSTPETPKPQKFDLDFPGGTPSEFVASVQRAAGRPVNVIIPLGQETVSLPAMRVKNVDVPQLFNALTKASQTSPVVRKIGDVYVHCQYGFMTNPQDTNDPLWYFYFHTDTPAERKSVSRFYQLAPYIERGLSVDDITTAIETSWKMLGLAQTPKLSFHKETKLLIAVGDSEQLKTIDAALSALELPSATAPAKATPRKSDK